jgi:DNA (cytosine-5)-methyltransferase 1
VLTDLETAGYATRTFNIPACSLGADHRRYRIWIVAYNLKSGTRMEEYRSCGQRGQTANTLQPAILLKTNGPISPERIGASCENVAHTFTKRRKRQKRSELPSVPSWEHQSSSRPDRGTPESDLDRITNGLPQRVDRIKCLGNAVYPRIPEFIGRQIMKYEEPVWK